MLVRHLKELEDLEAIRFRDGAGLDDPHYETVRRAKAVGASEVYRYLLSMSEEDINEDRSDVSSGSHSENE